MIIYNHNKEMQTTNKQIKEDKNMNEEMNRFWLEGYGPELNEFWDEVDDKYIDDDAEFYIDLEKEN